MMRFSSKLLSLTSSLLLVGCLHKGMNPDDPYESFNRKVHKFNMAFDAILLKPPAKIYKAVIPLRVRVSVNNFYNNVNLIPTVANDLLQANWRAASDDAGRFVLNTTLGVAGLFDVASNYHLPPHTNDLGLTFAHWGDRQSPYIVIPFLGPATIRDGMAMAFEYTFLTPYPYLGNGAVIWGLIGLRYVDTRAQLLESDRILDEALDKYSFIRDAWLQHRRHLICGDTPDVNDEAPDPLYVDEAAGGDDSAGADYVDDEPPPAKKSA